GATPALTGRRLAVGAEAVPATTFTGGVGVLDAEAAAHEVLDVVHVRALQEREAARVDHEPDAVILELDVAFQTMIVDGHAVLEAATPARLHEHSYRGVVLAAGRQQMLRLRRTGFGEAEAFGIKNSGLHSSLIACAGHPKACRRAHSAWYSRDSACCVAHGQGV